MGIRRNAKLLSGPEREAFVRACVSMKADVVDPTAPPNQRYSRWDEYVAIHWMIQDAFAPGAGSVNFGHGGAGSYSFLSWHRYFMWQFEQQLQSYVAGVMLPYWDWTDPASIMTDTFLGPNGTVGGEVRSGYFARNAPGTPGNPTPAPAWWPAGLAGWTLPAAFGAAEGPLLRSIGDLTRLPTADHLRQALAMTTYPAFQDALEAGTGLAPPNTMHNRLHGWIGGAFGQMSDPAYSPFDPFFYLHHCNIDRLWAMWQMDGHANEYPASGGAPHHRRDDLMYPWTAGAAGYGTNAAIASAIPMPDFSAVGAKRNGDTLDYRMAFDYTYDTLAVIGIGLDRTGSMNGLTPDPMVTAAPDVTKWEAAKRGVSAFLQDCETVQSSGSTYVLAGVKTFRSLAANELESAFPAPGYGLVKSGGAVSRSAFDSAVAGMTAEGGTPLTDALQDLHATVVEPPFARLPADERRYLAMLTDGLLTTGSPLSAIADGGLGGTAVFAMGFGTGAEVDYATLAALVAKGVTLPTQQVFHGENAGTIDKFYSDALAHAIGFTGVLDPVLELFAGEHAHVDFYATSADDAFLITVQGMDFDDGNWGFHLHAADGSAVYGDGADHAHPPAHDGCAPDVTATRSAGRLSIVLQRNNASAGCWVGRWQLMVAYKARRLDAMVMPNIGALLVPVAAGPARGPRFARLLEKPGARVATRNIARRPAHRLDARPVSTNRNDREACNAVVNIYARSRLQLALEPPAGRLEPGSPISIAVTPTVLQGGITPGRSFARLLAPTQDLAAVVAAVARKDIPKHAELKGSRALTFDPARVLAALEKRKGRLARLRDEELAVAVHEGGPPHVHVKATDVPGAYHVGVYVEGDYCPDHERGGAHDHHGGAADEDDAAEHEHAGSACHDGCRPERFLRLLTATVVLQGARKGRRRTRTRS